MRLLTLAKVVSGVLILGTSPKPEVVHADVGSLLREASSEYMRGGDGVGRSIHLFEQAIQERPAVKERLWQLGLSQYSLGQYDQCAAQFEYDYKRNPDDTEEVVWAYLCRMMQAPSSSRRETQTQMQSRRDAALASMPNKRPDTRPIMRTVERAYRTSDVSELLRVMSTYEESPSSSRAAESDSDYFYAALYTGLYLEADGDQEAAMVYLRKAADSVCGSQGSQQQRGLGSAGGGADYMTAVARVLVSRPR
jgi:tetratricopeptide (TPR) repeat protein